jgi:CubicO group peptidase (beta-lactamase class C family)
MKWNQKIAVWSLAVLFLACQDSKKLQSNEKDFSTPLDSLISELIENDELVGAELNIYQEGANTFQKVYGWSTLSKEKNIQKNDIWAVKSMTKPVTATAILILQDDGLLSLDDPVTKYIPQYQGYKESTIRHLLLQSSGDDGNHGNNAENIFDFNSQEKWVLDWANQKPKGTFGDYEYSNFNYEALGFIISQVSKKPVDEFIEERIIQPLGLENTHTYFSPTEVWAIRVPYRYKKSTEERVALIQTNKDEQTWKFFPASFGLWMSNEDFAIFLQMWMNKGKHKTLQILKENTVTEALKVGVWISKEDMAGQGLGWQIETDPFVYYKGGNDGSIGIAYPEKKTIIVFTTHMQGGKHGGKIWGVLGKYLLDWK